ncbi:hypothetical protein OE88DRAFT_1668933 [Heliocybe sulcata]|uniref:Uncharacterized protein n=1 Tax=Heliocybe sulcata TaxID=5364 RepID=A0A5C3MJR3_9AGAM|nr:hypothetical protein OE88DRAFT_1668933 [Heliocybe sulcata]
MSRANERQDNQNNTKRIEVYARNWATPSAATYIVPCLPFTLFLLTLVSLLHSPPFFFFSSFTSTATRSSLFSILPLAPLTTAKPCVPLLGVGLTPSSAASARSLAPSSPSSPSLSAITSMLRRSSTAVEDLELEASDSVLASDSGSPVALPIFFLIQPTSLPSPTLAILSALPTLLTLPKLLILPTLPLLTALDPDADLLSASESPIPPSTSSGGVILNSGIGALSFPFPLPMLLSLATLLWLIILALRVTLIPSALAFRTGMTTPLPATPKRENLGISPYVFAVIQSALPEAAVKEEKRCDTGRCCVSGLTGNGCEWLDSGEDGADCVELERTHSGSFGTSGTPRSLPLELDRLSPLSRLLSLELFSLPMEAIDVNEVARDALVNVLLLDDAEVVLVGEPPEDPGCECDDADEWWVCVDSVTASHSSLSLSLLLPSRSPKLEILLGFFFPFSFPPSSSPFSFVGERERAGPASGDERMGFEPGVGALVVTVCLRGPTGGRDCFEASAL